MAYDPTHDVVAQTRARLNSVHALLEETSLAVGDNDNAFWTKLQSHVLEETDAWLRAALLGRQALATCSPLCQSSAQVNFINGLTGPSKQLSDMGTESIYVSAAVFGALSQLLTVKPGLVMPQIEVQAFIVHLRQSINLLDERKQREEILLIIKEFLVRQKLDEQAEAVCIEFLKEDGTGIQAIATDGLLALAARGYKLHISLVNLAWKLMLHASTIDGRVAGVRLFRTVAVQHNLMEKLAHGLSLAASDRAIRVRVEATIAFRFVKSPWLNALLTKAQVDENNMEGKAMQLIGNGALLSLLEDPAQEVRCEASRSIVLGFTTDDIDKIDEEALEHAIVAHADACHDDSTMDTQLQFILSLYTLLQTNYQRQRKLFSFSLEQLEYLLGHSLRHSHAGGATTLLGALTFVSLNSPHLILCVLNTIADGVSPIFASAEVYQQKQILAHIATLGKQITPILQANAELQQRITASTSILLKALNSSSTHEKLLIKPLSAAKESTHRFKQFKEPPNSASQVDVYQEQSRVLHIELESLPDIETRYYTLVLGILDGLLQFRKTQKAPSQQLAETTASLMFVAGTGHAVLANELIALIHVALATDLESLASYLSSIPCTPLIQELARKSSIDQVHEAALDRLFLWWPSSWFNSSPNFQSHVHATIESRSDQDPLTGVAGWPCDIPLTLRAKNIKDPNSLIIQVHMPHQDPSYMEVTPRDLIWITPTLCQASLTVTVIPTLVGLVHVNIVACLRCGSSALQPIGLTARVPVTIARMYGIAQADSLRKVQAWQEYDKRWRNAQPLIAIHGENGATQEADVAARTTSKTKVADDDKENGGPMNALKKRRLTTFLGPPGRVERLRARTQVATNSTTETPRDDHTQMQELLTQVASAVKAIPSELRREIDEIKSAHKEDIERLSMSFSERLARLEAKSNEESTALMAIHEAKYKQLEDRYQELATKHKALKDTCEKDYDEAASTVMPILNELENNLLASHPHGDYNDHIHQLRQELRKCLILAKSREEDKQELLFSNQVYLQHINELQQKLVTVKRENATLHKSAQDADAKSHALLDDVVQLKATLLPALEKAMAQNHQLKLKNDALQRQLDASSSQ